jgi:hypothetical protein
MVFSAGLSIPEFQRQVATPNVPKFTAALVALVDKNVDEELKVSVKILRKRWISHVIYRF